jgi:hypothetical protein
MRGGGAATSATGDALFGGEFRPHADVISQRLGDESVLLHLGTNEIYSLNTTATRFWDLFSTGSDDASIVQQLTAEFAVDEESLRAEATALLTALESYRLVER